MSEIHHNTFPVPEMPWHKNGGTKFYDDGAIRLAGKKGGRLTMRRSPTPGIIELHIENDALMGDTIPILIDSRDIQSAAIAITANGTMED